MNTAAEVGLNFLMNAAWQLIAIAIVALVADRLMRDAPRARHFIWVGALLLSLLLPLLSAAATLTGTKSTALPAVVDVPLVVPTNIDTTLVPDSWSLSTIHVSPRFAVLLLTLFIIALAFRCVRMCRAWLNTRGIRRDATVFEPRDEVLSVVRQCQSAFGISDCVLLSSSSLRSPATLGTLKPVLILPVQLIREADASALTAAVGHELAHIRRRDYFFNLIYEIIFLPLSVHPAAHFIKRRITQTRELRCDELVAQRLLQPDVYAKSLVRLASWAVPLNQRTHSIIVGMADADILEVRIMSLLKKTRANFLTTMLLAIGAVALLAIPCIAAASFGLNFRVDATQAQEPSRQAERRKLTDEQKAEIETVQTEMEALRQKISQTTDDKIKTDMVKQLRELEMKAYSVRTNGDMVILNGQGYKINEEGARREREMDQKQNSVLAGMAKISMDQAIQIATSKTPGKVIQCSLVGEHWEAPGKLAKDGLVLYHVVILSGDDSAPVMNHVLVNALDGSIWKSAGEPRRKIELAPLNKTDQ